MMEIFDSEELEINKAIEKANIAVSRFGIIRSFYEQKLTQDFPKFIIFHAQGSKSGLFSDGIESEYNTTGSSHNLNLAKLKALSEIFERYSGTVYRSKYFIKGSFNELKEKAFNPCDVVSFSKKQLSTKDFEKFRFDKNTNFKWIEGISLISGKKILVPVQLVYWNYRVDSEPIIQVGLSTGIAGGTSYAGATLRAIFEIVERDAFMITWLNQLNLKEIEFSKKSQLKKMTDEFKRYKFELHVFYSKTNVKIHSFIAIMIDRTRNPPIIGCGLKAGLNPEETIIASIEESFHSMPWRRDIAVKIPNKKIKPEAVSSFEDRILYWNQRGKLKELNFLLENSKKIELSELQNYSTGSCLKDLEFVKEDFKEKNLETIVVDITPIDVKQMEFKEVKVLVPKMQPLYLNEKYRYLGGHRLYEIPILLGFKNRREEELNKTPHPFL